MPPRPPIDLLGELYDLLGVARPAGRTAARAPSTGLPAGAMPIAAPPVPRPQAQGLPAGAVPITSPAPAPAPAVSPTSIMAQPAGRARVQALQPPSLTGGGPSAPPPPLTPPRAAPIPGVTPGVPLPSDPAAAQGVQRLTGRQPLVPSQAAPAARPGQSTLPPGTRPTWLNQTPDLRQGFSQHIAPHMTEEQFTQRYFGGFHNQGFSASHNPRTGDFSLRGELRVPPGNTAFRDRSGQVLPEGSPIGTISRSFNPSTGEAYNAYFQIRDNIQSQGLSKWILKNQVDVYRQIGVHTVKVHANIDVGGYTWAKFGFVPEPRDWQYLAQTMEGKVDRLVGQRQLTPVQADLIKQILRSPDPKSIWEIADLRIPIRTSAQRSRVDTAGKYLLVDSSWHGDLNLRDPDTVRRFDGYTANATAPGSAPP